MIRLSPQLQHIGLPSLYAIIKTRGETTTENRSNMLTVWFSIASTMFLLQSPKSLGFIEIINSKKQSSPDINCNMWCLAVSDRGRC